MGNKNDILVFRRKRETLKIYCDDIVFFESSGHYIDIRMQSGEVYRIRSTMSALGKMVDGRGFLQVHRGIVVNLKFVRSMHKNDIILDAVWKCVPVSRSCREKLEKAFEIYNK